MLVGETFRRLAIMREAWLEDEFLVAARLRDGVSHPSAMFEGPVDELL